MNVNVAEMVKAGMTAEDIQAIIAKEIEAAKAKVVVKNAAAVKTAEKIVSTGKVDTTDVVALAIEVVKEKMPNVKELLDEIGGFSDADIVEGAKELDKALAMYDQIIKIALVSGYDVSDLTKSKSGSSDLTSLLKAFASQH